MAEWLISSTWKQLQYWASRISTKVNGVAALPSLLTSCKILFMWSWAADTAKDNCFPVHQFSPTQIHPSSLWWKWTAVILVWVLSSLNIPLMMVNHIPWRGQFLRIGIWQIRSSSHSRLWVPTWTEGLALIRWPSSPDWEQEACSPVHRSNWESEKLRKWSNPV